MASVLDALPIHPGVVRGYLVNISLFEIQVETELRSRKSCAVSVLFEPGAHLSTATFLSCYILTPCLLFRFLHLCPMFDFLPLLVPFRLLVQERTNLRPKKDVSERPAEIGMPGMPATPTLNAARSISHHLLEEPSALPMILRGPSCRRRPCYRSVLMLAAV